MSTLVNTNFESGTNGATITTGGAGTEPTYSSNPGTWTYSNAHKVGALAAKCDTGGGAAFQALTKTFTAVADTSGGFSFWVSALPAAQFSLAIRWTGTGSTVGAAVKINPAGNIIIANGGSTVDTSSLNISALTRYVLEWYVNSTTHLQELRIFAGADIGGPTPTEVLTGTYSGATLVKDQSGVPASPPASYQVWIDDPWLTDVYTAPLPPPGGVTTFVTETFEVGGVLGDPVTGASTDFDAVTGGHVTYDNAFKVGTLSAKCDSSSPATAQILSKTFSVVPDVTLKWNDWFPVIPPFSALTIASVQNGATTLASVRLNTDGTLAIADAGIEKARSALVVAINTRVQFEWHVNSSIGAQELRIFVGADIGGSTPTAYIQGLYSGIGLTKQQYGLVAGAPPNFLCYLDNVTGTDEFVAPLTTPPITRLLDEDFEQGTDGVALDTSNSQFTVFGGTSVFDDAFAKAGSLSLLVDTGAGATFTPVRKNFTAVTTGKIRARWYRYITAFPISITHVTRMMASGSTLVASVRINTDGKIGLLNAATLVDTSTVAVAINRWARFEWTLDLDAHTQQLDIFTGGNLEGTIRNIRLTGALTGATISGAVWGALAGQSANFKIRFDDCAVDTAIMPPPTGADGGTTFARDMVGGVLTNMIVHDGLD